MSALTSTSASTRPSARAAPSAECPPERPPAPRSHSTPSPRALLAALLDASDLETVVPATLAVVERDPLAAAGCFRGDLLRGLMEVPGRVWTRFPQLYARYVSALRAAARARRHLPAPAQMEFWSVLDQRVLAVATPNADAAVGPGGLEAHDRSDEVHEAALGSFSASDPPARNGTRTGAPHAAVEP